MDNQIVIDPEFQALIPALSESEFDQLADNLLSEGCRDALVLWNGILIDGHNRYTICTNCDLPFRTTSIDLPDRNAAMDWIEKNQLGRRNLTPDQTSLLRGRRYNRMKQCRGGDRKSAEFVESKAQSEPLITAELLAEEYGVGAATIKRDAARAEFVDSLPKDTQRAILDGEVRIHAVKREIRKEQVRKDVASPTAKYRVLYVDPPWAYRDVCDTGSIQSGGAARQYPTMTITELRALPVPDWCEPNAVLFLWVTSPLLFDALPVIQAWGFQYKASFVWDKVKHNLGHYNSVRHEFLLICTRGSCTPDNVELFDSVQSIEKTTHSTKPEEFRRIIDVLYPFGKRLELFARQEPPVGWACWGNEVEVRA